MIRILIHLLQALIVTVLSRRVFLVLGNLNNSSDGVSAADITAVLQAEYTGLRWLINKAEPLPMVSCDFTIGSFNIEDLTSVIRDLSLDGGVVLANNLEGFRRDVQKIVQQLQTF